MTTTTVTPRPWDALDPVGRFLVAAVALLDRAEAEGVNVAIDGTMLPAGGGVEAAVVVLCRTLRVPMTPDEGDVAWARAQLVASSWDPEAVSDGLLLWIEDQGYEAVIV